MSLSASVNDQRCRFNTKVAELRATQGKNVRMFTDDEYHEYLRKVKDIRSPGHRMVPSDFYLIKRFSLRYATFETLFDIIKDVHEQTWKKLQACKQCLRTFLGHIVDILLDKTTHL